MSPMRLAATMLALLMLAGSGECLIYVPTPWRTSQTPVPLTSEPSHHLALSNPYVRVFRVEAAPHASTLIHRHDHDYMWVSLGPSDITNNVVGKDPAAAHVEDGEVRFVAGGFAHSVTNNSSQPFRNITIELLQHGSRQLKPGEDEREMTLMNSGSIERLLLRDGVRASEIELKPGGSFSRENPGLHLVIVGGGRCVSMFAQVRLPGRKRFLVFECNETPASASDQMLRWVEKYNGSESFNNTGQKPARILILDF